MTKGESTTEAATKLLLSLYFQTKFIEIFYDRTLDITRRTSGTNPIRHVTKSHSYNQIHQLSKTSQEPEWHKTDAKEDKQTLKLIHEVKVK